MNDILPPDGEGCVLLHKCRSDSCKESIFIVPGWDLSLPIVEGGTRGDRFHHYIKHYLKNHDTYYCKNLPYYENKHAIGPITEALEEEVTRINKNKQVILIGTSYGGTIVQKFASRNPKKTKKIALLFTIDSFPHEENLNLDRAEIKGIYDFAKRIPMVNDYINNLSEYGKGEGSLEDLFNYLDTNLIEENKNIQADTFVLNCDSDTFIGTIPNISGAKLKIKSPCTHHVFFESDIKEVADFIDD